MSNATTQALLASGVALVAMPYGHKGPTAKGWNLRENCFTDPAQCGSLVGMNMGIAHAYCTPTLTCAIDIDNYKHAKPWLAGHGIDLHSHLFAADAIVIMSGKKYSLKLLYRLPSGIPALASIKVGGPDGKSAIEFRCASKDGKTVQDVLPPSRHPDGHDYAWMGEGNPLQIPEIPKEILALWRTLIQKPRNQKPNQQAQQGQKQNPPWRVVPRLESPREIATIKDALKYINADCDYEAWRNAVWALLSTGWQCAEDIARDWSKTAPHRYEESSFRAVLTSYRTGAPNPISLGTIYHHARRGGWNG